jgi:hypothetical protein
LKGLPASSYLAYVCGPYPVVYRQRKDGNLDRIAGNERRYSTGIRNAGSLRAQIGGFGVETIAYGPNSANPVWMM